MGGHKMESFYIKNIVFIENTDIDYLEEFSSKAVLWGSYTPLGVDPYTLQIFIPDDYDYEILPPDSEVFTNIYAFKEETSPDSPASLIFPAEKFLSKFDLKQIVPQCDFYIPGSNQHEDKALSLYDYPFTMLPFNSQCINPAMGASSHSPIPCIKSDPEKIVSDCEKYIASNKVTIGVIEDVPVTVSRFTNGNVYSYQDLTFGSYDDFILYVEDGNLDYQLTFLPNGNSDEMYPSIMKRLNAAYGI